MDASGKKRWFYPNEVDIQHDDKGRPVGATAREDGDVFLLDGLAAVIRPTGSYGKCTLKSDGKDTTTGHWEMMGIRLDRAFPLYPHGFPAEIMEPFEAAVGRMRDGDVLLLENLRFHAGEESNDPAFAKAPGRLAVSHSEAVDTRGVLTGHLAQDFRAMQRERRLGQCLARVRPRAVAVRVVRGPHHIVDADAWNQLDSELLVFVGGEHLPREDLAGQHPDLVILDLRSVLV